MNKFFLAILFVSLIALASCRNEENKESFSKMLKEDSSRLKEFKNVCDSIRKEESKDFKKRHSKLDAATIDDLRIKDKDHPTIEKDGYTRIKMLNQDLYDIMDELAQDDHVASDSLVFTLGIIRNQQEADTYNKENGGTNYPLYDNIGHNGLYGRPLLMVYSQETSGEKIDAATVKTAVSATYSPGRLCPPPYPCN